MDDECFVHAKSKKIYAHDDVAWRRFGNGGIGKNQSQMGSSRGLSTTKRGIGESLLCRRRGLSCRWKKHFNGLEKASRCVAWSWAECIAES